MRIPITNTARLLRMGDTLAEHYRAMPSARGEAYLAQWPEERAQLLRKLSAEDGRTVEARAAMKDYRRQRQAMGMADSKQTTTKPVANFQVLGVMPEVLRTDVEGDDRG
jgi:hypothetical protein